MELRIVKILSPIGKPSVTLKTDAESFDAIANNVKKALGIDSFENLKAIISINNSDDGVKRELRGLELAPGDIRLYLTQDKTSNGLSKAEQIAECEARLEKTIRLRKGGVGKVREELAALKGESIQTKPLISKATKREIFVEKIKKESSKKELKQGNFLKEIEEKLKETQEQLKAAEKKLKELEKSKTPTCEIISTEECIPVDEVDTLMHYNLKVRRK